MREKIKEREALNDIEMKELLVNIICLFLGLHLQQQFPFFFDSPSLLTATAADSMWGYIFYFNLNDDEDLVDNGKVSSHFSSMKFWEEFKAFIST